MIDPIREAVEKAIKEARFIEANHYPEDNAEEIANRCIESLSRLKDSTDSVDKPKLADGQGWCDKHRVPYATERGCGVCRINETGRIINTTPASGDCRFTVKARMFDKTTWCELRHNGSFLYTFEHDAETMQVLADRLNELQPQLPAELVEAIRILDDHKAEIIGEDVGLKFKQSQAEWQSLAYVRSQMKG